ncbi:MAG: P-loop NTPase fold protein [Janthinobacterium lividum]
MKQVKLIREVPGEIDELGSHTKVATALTELLSSSFDARVIGLLGRWGSGKSTTINIAQTLTSAKSQSTTKTPFFVYDAWAQQSDPPRRAFLEALVRYLVKEGIVTEKAFKDEIDLLVSKAEIHDIETTPTLTGWGTALAVSLALVPIGLFLGKPENSLQWLGNIFLFGPIIIVIISQLAGKIWEGSDKNSAREARSVATLFFNKTVDRLRNTILKNPEPTSLEFRDSFYRIMDNSLVSAKQTIIVIDNLDRLPTKDALTMWASIRSLIDISLKSDADRSNYKVVVPFDQIAIQKLFEDENKNLSQDEASIRAQSFIEKTFDAILLVGPPIDSDWREYLEKSLIKSFGNNISASDRIHCARVFESFLPSQRDAVETTPRRLNHYVNSLVTTWMQWGDTVSFASVSYFCARKMWADPSLADVLKRDATAEALMNRLAKDWRMEVAAIHFGVTQAKARQLVIQPEIEKAVSECDLDHFADLARLPGFSRTLETWLQEKGGSSFEGIDPASLLNVASFMQNTLEDTPETTEAWVAVGGAAQNLSAWSKTTAQANSGAQALRARGVSTADLIAGLMNKNAQILAPTGWLEMVDAVLPEAGRQVALKSAKAPFTGGGYLNLLEAASSREWIASRHQLQRCLSPTDTPENVISNLEARLGEAEPKSILHIVRAMTSLETKWDFSSLAGSFEARAVALPEDLSSLIEAMLLIADPMHDALVRLADNGTLAHLFAVALESGDSRALAVAVFCLALNSRARLSGDTSRGNASKGWEALQNLDQALEGKFDLFAEAFNDVYQIKTSFNKTNDARILRFLLTSAASNTQWQRLLHDHIIYILENSTFGRSHFVDEVLQHAPLVKSLLAPSMFRAFVDKISNYSWAEALKETGDDSFWAIAESVKNSSRPKIPLLVEQVEERLSAFTPQSWSRVLTSPPPYLDDLLGALGKTLPRVAKPNFISGFEQWANTYQSGGAPLAVNEAQAARLFGLLPVATRRVWAKTLTEHMTAVPPDRSLPLLLTLGRSFINTLDDNNLPDRLARSILLKSILSEDNAQVMALSQSWDIAADIISRSSEDFIADISSRSAWLEKIAALRGTTSDDLILTFSGMPKEN